MALIVGNLYFVSIAVVLLLLTILTSLHFFPPLLHFTWSVTVKRLYSTLTNNRFDSLSGVRSNQFLNSLIYLFQPYLALSSLFAFSFICLPMQHNSFFRKKHFSRLEMVSFGLHYSFSYICTCTNSVITYASFFLGTANER